MKRIIILLFVTLFNIVVTAQNKKSSIQKSSFEVKGVCGQCKERIEGCLIEVAGVKKAVWNKKTHILDVVYNTDKISLDKIKHIVVGTGHDTEDMKADDATYKSLPSCCAYRDGANCTH